MVDKYTHVRRNLSAPAGNHHCHWPGCGYKVPAAVWGCKRHWAMLPKYLKNRIWATYRAGQEISKTPSRDYVRAAMDVQDWVMITRHLEYDL